MKPLLSGRRILVVDDELAIRKAIQQRLIEDGAVAETADTVQAARSSIEANEYDLVILDHRLPDGTGLGFLESLQKTGFPGALIMMTAYATTQDAVRAMKAGAADYLLKPFDLDEMLVVAERAVENRAMRSEIKRFRARDRAEASIQNIIGESSMMHQLRELVQRIGDSGARTILIYGESGTGKDLIARAIHYCSPEAEQLFLNITCTALPETLLESELFGHEKGAFTDAKTAKRGLFEEADGGTIFLDEIGDMPLSLQGKLLRFLESKTFRRVGGLREICVDVRVIAATNRNLMEAIEDNRFRSDLYYRLNVIPIEAPALRERLEDVAPLTEHFVRHFAAELRKPVRVFHSEALQMLASYHWPGNVRELRNCVERAVLLGTDETLGVQDLPREILRSKGEGAGGNHHPTMVLPGTGVVFDELVRSLLDQALERCSGNKSQAAGLLGIHRDQVRYWVKKYGLSRWVRTRSES
jgi:DNA-binding NtrC family response regulator